MTKKEEDVNPLDTIRHQKILDKDVEEWTDDDLRAMIAYYREARDRFALSEINKAEKRPKDLKEALEQKL